MITATPTCRAPEAQNMRHDAESDAVFLLRVAAFGARKHRVQRRKDAKGSAYIKQPITLAHLLASEAGVTDRSVLAAAVLHDTVEDTDTTAEALAAAFGRQVASIVLEVTDDKTLPKAERKQQQIVYASHRSVPAQLVKLADQIANLRDLGASAPAGWSVERRREYVGGAKHVSDVLRGVHPRLEAPFDANTCTGRERPRTRGPTSWGPPPGRSNRHSWSECPRRS